MGSCVKCGQESWTPLANVSRREEKENRWIRATEVGQRGRVPQMAAGQYREWGEERITGIVERRHWEKSMKISQRYRPQGNGVGGEIRKEIVREN